MLPLVPHVVGLLVEIDFTTGDDGPWWWPVFMAIKILFHQCRRCENDATMG